MVAVEEPFRAAVIHTCSKRMPVAAAVKVAVVAPEATATLAGTVTAGLPLDNVTVSPADGAALTSVTVQSVELPLVTVAALHVTEDT